MLTKLLRSVWDRLGATDAPSGVAARTRTAGLNPIPSRIDLVDDRVLLELAREPKRPLFPLLRDDVSIAPLVWLLAVVAPLLTLSSRSLTDNDALWGCRALECVSVDRFGEFLDPASRDRDVPFPWQPPLVTWLTSLVLTMMGCERAAALFVIPWLSAAALIASMALFARVLGGNRAALFAVLLAASHPQLVQATPRAAPGNAALALVLLTLWGFSRHWNTNPSVVSWPLVLGGICGGLCLLAGGPVALALFAVIGLYVAWWAAGRRWAPSPGEVRGVHWGRRHIVPSTGVLAAAAAFCGGGWLVLMLFRYGSLFAVNWLTWRSGSTIDATSSAELSIGWWDNFSALTVPLYGTLSLLGVVRIVADHWHRTDAADWRQRRLLLAWGGVALVTWVCGGMLVHATPDGEQAWRGFVVAPLLLLAAVGLTEIADRRIPFEFALPLLLAAVVWGVESGEWGTAAAATPDPILPQLLRFVAAVLLASAGFLAFHAVRGSRRGEARLLTGLIGAILVLHVGSGWRNLSAATARRELALPQTHQSFSQLGQVRHVTFVSQEGRSGGKPTPPPPLLTYLVKSHWPRATLATAASWEQALANAPAPIAPDEDPDLDAADNASLPAHRTTPPHVVILWGLRGRVNLPPLLGPARRHGPILSLSEVDAAIFAVPAPAAPP